MTINDFAKKIAKREGLKKQVNIAQIKEVLKCVREELKASGQPDLYNMIKFI